MNLRGTRNLFEETMLFRQITERLRTIAEQHGYKEIIPSLLAPASLFIQKAGQEILDTMYTFKDKGGRNVCLIPEVTAVLQDIYKREWMRGPIKKPVKVYYLSRCYRYDRPQRGRYREFWQFGVEQLGGGTKEEMIALMQEILDVPYELKTQVKRGLDYYVEDGFEAECALLGAQKQIAGGGRYNEGIGFAIGVDRIMCIKQLTL